MAKVRKVLGQSYPTAATATKIYTVPASKDTVISSITVNNQSTTTSDTFTVAIRVAGAADSTKDKLYTTLTILPLDTFIATVGLTLATTDEIWITSTNGTCSFQLFGQENL